MELDKVLDKALNDISLHYSVDKISLKQMLDNKFNRIDFSDSTIKNIIIPCNGIIDKTCCRGILFNRGLYTQCPKKSKTRFCKICVNEKYGNIDDRIRYPIGTYVTKDGKKEVPYDKFVKKMGYNISDVIKCLQQNSIEYHLVDNKSGEKKARGRPKNPIKEENQINLEEEIEVVKISIMGKSYYKTNDNVLLDCETFDIIGILDAGKIEEIHNRVNP